MTARILVVDDEPGMRDMLVDTLTLAGHSAASATDGFDALKVIRAEKFDLIISDVNMPKMNGFELLENLRDHNDMTPVILLTARADRSDVTTGLKFGADDYVTKPFGLEELTLRVAAILRRTKGEAQVVTLHECGPLSLDEERHLVTMQGKPVELSPTEFRLLLELIERQGKVVTKTHLLDRVWGMGFATGATVVDTYISYLRKKLHTDTWQGIKTVRGIGFQIEP